MAAREESLLKGAREGTAISGEFLHMAGDRYYAIRNVDEIAPFFVSVISNTDHWLFVSSTGGLTAGRVSPDTALFPYVTVDKIHESGPHTGAKTLLRVTADEQTQDWEPFRSERSERYSCTRNIYKNTLGNKICLEEINNDLQVVFRYFWLSSDEFGFVRHCELQNIGQQDINVEILDGLQNILPAGTPRFAQTNSSNLVDAYKWSELDSASGLATYSLYSGITDRAEPCESLRASTIFCLGLSGHKTLISSEQINNFRNGHDVRQEHHTRGVRGAYFINTDLHFAAGELKHWQMVANIEQDQSQVIGIQDRLNDQKSLAADIETSVDAGSKELACIMASADAFQATAEENVSTHHYANVLFNVLRGGIFDDQYRVSSKDYGQTIRHFSLSTYQDNRDFISALPEIVDFTELQSLVATQNDPQLQRLSLEYLPITFGRRHGDPSRPWNEFAIKLKDDNGNRLLSYQGNWRDIFQNWEALLLSYPEYIESVIAKFVNASTIDGYNPYRITKEGIDWEVEEPENPWSYIGYWGDHQIVYLLKFLELSRQTHPDRLGKLLRSEVFCYANVPYRLRSFDAIIKDPKNTVIFDEEVASRIETRVAQAGADGKLILDQNGNVYQVNLLEKMLVPLLSKLGNLVIDGGIWLNTQRPEWNDANNALVGQGLSMVTLYYMRRYVRFFQDMIAHEGGEFRLSSEVDEWMQHTGRTLASMRPNLGNGPVSEEQRYNTLVELGQAASAYRANVYERESFSGRSTCQFEALSTLLDDALAAIDQSISSNKGEDGLYNAYNLLQLNGGTAKIRTLYPMLEGQVAALSAGAIAPAEAADVVEALFNSSVYRPDQQSFMLYPDRKLPKFLDKNKVPDGLAEKIPFLQRMLVNGDNRIVERDPRGDVRFNSEFSNVGVLNDTLDSLTDIDSDEIATARQALNDLYERVFNHEAFTGRSGGMFGFEGLGSVYWHMVSKLLLAVQENFFASVDADSDPAVQQRLAKLYYRVRQGIGFNKTPGEYGAFPTDPYSHTPKHAGARQPGMTGQVKEEILTRFGELGIRLAEGAAHLQPNLLRRREFTTAEQDFWYLDVADKWQQLMLEKNSLAFTWCQVPFVYTLYGTGSPTIAITSNNSEQLSLESLLIPADTCAELFQRSGRIKQITVSIPDSFLYSG